MNSTQPTMSGDMAILSAAARCTSGVPRFCKARSCPGIFLAAHKFSRGEASLPYRNFIKTGIAIGTRTPRYDQSDAPPRTGQASRGPGGGRLVGGGRAPVLRMGRSPTKLAADRLSGNVTVTGPSGRVKISCKAPGFGGGSPRAAAVMGSPCARTAMSKPLLEGCRATHRGQIGAEIMSNELRELSAEQLDAVSGGDDRLSTYEVQDATSDLNQAGTLSHEPRHARARVLR